MAAATIANVAVLHASLKVLLGDRTAIWEPTRRRVRDHLDMTAGV
jgi:hypothetical protein